jgi:virginiamycin B lyase
LPERAHFALLALQAGKLYSLAFLLNTSATVFAQTITEYPIPTSASGPAGIARGPDGAMWFTESNANKIGRVTTAGVFTEYSLPPCPPYTVACQKFPLGIASGPDGALWFTEVNANNIGRITVDGAITEYPVPTPSSDPYGIVSGPDGALWFTEFTAYSFGAIGRITTVGAATDYPPVAQYSFSPLSNPYAIASGSDGALWFTEGNHNGKIGRITTASIITEYPLPSKGAPTGIASGPDSALWFTDFSPNGQNIWRITIIGDFTKFPLPSCPPSNCVKDPYAITSGPDDALWFTEPGGNNIGRITVDGAITEYPVPTPNSDPNSIANGPDGALWFTEGNGNKIARIALISKAPTISVVNGASYATGPVAPGSIASIFGNFLGLSPTSASVVPLPTALDGAEFEFTVSGGSSSISAPIFFASTQQANIQIPWELAGQSQLTVLLHNQAGAPQTVTLTPFAPGIFSTNATGTGQGAILDSNYDLVDSSNPTTAGNTLQIFCTGLGAVSNPPQDGSPAPSSPPSTTLTMPTVTIGSGGAAVLFSGLAPGFIGLYQVNVEVPAAVAKGNAVPVVISIGGVSTNTVTIAVD